MQCLRLKAASSGANVVAKVVVEMRGVAIFAVEALSARRASELMLSAVRFVVERRDDFTVIGEGEIEGREGIGGAARRGGVVMSTVILAFALHLVGLRSANVLVKPDGLLDAIVEVREPIVVIFDVGGTVVWLSLLSFVREFARFLLVVGFSLRSHHVVLSCGAADGR